jgi:hypothetical protein
MPDKVIRCRFDLDHEMFPSGFYDVRWFWADDRGKLVEILDCVEIPGRRSTRG